MSQIGKNKGMVFLIFVCRALKNCRTILMFFIIMTNVTLKKNKVNGCIFRNIKSNYGNIFDILKILLD